MENIILFVAVLGILAVAILSVWFHLKRKYHEHKYKPVTKYTLSCDLCNTFVTYETTEELSDDDYICPLCDSYMELDEAECCGIKNKNFSYDYPMPAVTTDAVIFNYSEGKLYVLLINRQNDPHKGQWALPGGYVEINETIIDGLKREVYEETGIDLSTDVCVSCENVNVYDQPRRDPRGRVISVVSHYVMLPECVDDISAGDDASDVKWFLIDDLPKLAFDHNEIINDAIMNKNLLEQWNYWSIHNR